MFFGSDEAEYHTTLIRSPSNPVNRGLFSDEVAPSLHRERFIPSPRSGRVDGLDLNSSDVEFQNIKSFQDLRQSQSAANYSATPVLDGHRGRNHSRSVLGCGVTGRGFRATQMTSEGPRGGRGARSILSRGRSMPRPIGASSPGGRCATSGRGANISAPNAAHSQEDNDDPFAQVTHFPNLVTPML
ncbi:hypothetical protein Zm00014a_019976 [Zea mays]|uniref:Uncharacterized protein n=1 Tax=Zea mays TaxID=4577 RepID=A0A3L6GC30_MAIZE|nr:hypothetical protein Zm00014a_019976 [Zea mays]